MEGDVFLVAKSGGEKVAEKGTLETEVLSF